MNQQDTPHKRTVDCLQAMEEGDLFLLEHFDEAILMLGNTKLERLPHAIYWPILPSRFRIKTPASQKYSTAVIGNTAETETHIPNIFQVKFKDTKGNLKIVCLIDQQGYSNCYGFHRTFLGGHFTYRIYSKTPKLKFILAIKQNELEGTGESFKNILFNFIDTFKNYSSNKEDILKATVFLITQADPQTNLEEIVRNMQMQREGPNPSMTNQQINAYQEMIDYMIKNSKIFFLQKLEYANNRIGDNDLLLQIYEKSSFWQRKQGGREVDISSINFSFAYQILAQLQSIRQSSRLFKQDFFYFMDYMQERFNSILLSHQFSLIKIVKTLHQDAVNGVQSHSFLDGMAEFNKTFYQFSENLREKRETIESKFFSRNEPNEVQIGNQQQKQMKSAYFIQKFKVLVFISDKATEYYSDQQKKGGQIRTIEYLEKFSIILDEIFKKFNLLRIQRSDSQIIFKCNYVIQRLIEQFKIITLIFYVNKETQKLFDVIKAGTFDIFRSIQDKIISQLSQCNIDDLVSYLDAVNEEIISFLESLPDIYYRMTLGMAKILLKYSEIIGSRKYKTSASKKRFVALKLLQTRNRLDPIYRKLILYSEFYSDTKQVINIFFRLNLALGNLLFDINLDDQARRVFQSMTIVSLTQEKSHEISEAIIALEDANKK